MFQNLKIVNPLGGIQAERIDDGVSVYFAPGELVHDLALAGTLGPVAPYVPPPPPEKAPTYATEAEAVAAMVAWIEEFTDPLIGGTPEEERLSWPVKEVAARAYLGGAPSDDERAMIEGEAAVTGEDAAELAELILAKAAPYRAAVSALAGLRRKVAAALAAVTDPHQYEPTLLAAKEEARALAVSLGLGAAFGIEEAAE